MMRLVLGTTTVQHASCALDLTFIAFFILRVKALPWIFRLLYKAPGIRILINFDDWLLTWHRIV